MLHNFEYQAPRKRADLLGLLAEHGGAASLLEFGPEDVFSIGLKGSFLVPIGAELAILTTIQAGHGFQAGLSIGEANRWRRVPPQLDCPAQRVARGAADLWWPAGQPAGVSGLRLRDVASGEESQLDVDGVFVAIGHTPNTAIFRGQVQLDDDGYVMTAPGTTRTSVAGVFAAGDVQDKVWRQAVTAAGTGCMAALEAEKWLAAQGADSAMAAD